MSSSRSLIGFDVGVGKTYTALAILIRARQEGRLGRPAFLVPSSVERGRDDNSETPPADVPGFGKSTCQSTNPAAKG